MAQCEIMVRAHRRLPKGRGGRIVWLIVSYIGTVTHGVVVLPADAKLDEGTKVRVEPVTAQPIPGTLGQRMMRFAGIVKGLPSDMARNHDHYLHGRPKQ